MSIGSNAFRICVRSIGIVAIGIAIGTLVASMTKYHCVLLPHAFGELFVGFVAICISTVE